MSSKIRVGDTFLLIILVHMCYTAQRTGLAQNIAIALQVLLGALTTALGAALSGKKVCDI